MRLKKTIKKPTVLVGFKFDKDFSFIPKLKQFAIIKQAISPGAVINPYVTVTPQYKRPRRLVANSKLQNIYNFHLIMYSKLIFSLKPVIC